MGQGRSEMEKSRNGINWMLVFVFLVLILSMGTLVYVQSEKREEQERQAGKCIANDSIPVQVFGTFDVMCVMKGSNVDEDRMYNAGEEVLE